jgi:hypothetical protein
MLPPPRSTDILPKVVSALFTTLFNSEFKIYDAAGSNDAIAKERNLSCKTKTVNNLWSQGYSQRLCHAHHNVKLSIITSFKQRQPRGVT